MNLMIFIFLISIQFCCLFRMILDLLIFINVQVVFQTLKLAVMAKVRGFFYLIVGNCDEHMHHVDLSDKNYLSDCF